MKYNSPFFLRQKSFGTLTSAGPILKLPWLFITARSGGYWLTRYTLKKMSNPVVDAPHFNIQTPDWESMTFQEAKEVAIEQMKGSIWFYPTLQVNHLLADMVIRNILLEIEARDILFYQKLKQDDREHMNRRPGNHAESSAMFSEACENLTKRWYREKRDSSTRVSSKLSQWSGQIIEGWIEDWNQIKDFFGQWLLSLMYAAIIWYLVSDLSGMPDLVGFFIVGGTVIFSMHFAATQRKELLLKMERSDFDKRLLLNKATTDFPVAKAILIFFFLVFLLSAIRGCPDSIH